MVPFLAQCMGLFQAGQLTDASHRILTAFACQYLSARPRCALLSCVCLAVCLAVQLVALFEACCSGKVA